jgi:hypothetical protein
VGVQVTVVATERNWAAVFMSWHTKVPLDARKGVDVIVRTENWLPLPWNLGKKSDIEFIINYS